jgi:hypothetical protein
MGTAVTRMSLAESAATWAAPKGIQDKDGGEENSRG